MRPLCVCWCNIMAIHHRYVAERIIQSLLCHGGVWCLMFEMKQFYWNNKIFRSDQIYNTFCKLNLALPLTIDESLFTARQKTTQRAMSELQRYWDSLDLKIAVVAAWRSASVRDLQPVKTSNFNLNLSGEELCKKNPKWYWRRGLSWVPRVLLASNRLSAPTPLIS